MTDAGPVASDVPERFQVRFEGKTLLGIYRVDRELAAGGMGSVYLAQDQNLGRRVVVKVPHARFLAEPGFRTRFRREVSELVRLEHPSVVRILAQGEEGDVPYFVLQYLGGGSLEERIAKGPQSASAALEWLTTVARTLDFVHAQGVVHRDVKPANILFDERGHVFLSDFGVVKALEGEATTAAVTEAGAGVGSPLYMAPEQALGRQVDARSDQYALATTLYEALAGAPPYGRGSLVELILAKDKKEAPPLQSVAPAVPEACAAAVHRGLRRDPDERFPSCGALAAAFRAGLEAATTPALVAVPAATPAPAPVPALAPPSAPTPALSPATPVPSATPAAPPRRRVTLAIGVAPLLVVLLVVGFASGWFRGKAPEAEPPKVAPEPEGSQQVVRVAAAGAEPRRLLRMKFAEGVEHRLRATSEFDLSQQVGDQRHEIHPRSEVVITAKVKAVSRDGDAWVQWTFDRARTLPPKETPDAEPPSNRFFEQIGVVSGTGTLSPRGVASDVALSRSGPRDPSADEMVSTYTTMVRTFGFLLPPTPVGIGAEWVVTGFEKYGDLTYESTRTCRLVEQTGDLLRIRIDTVYGGGKQGVPFQRSDDRDWKLEKLSGTLEGEVVLDLTHPLAVSMDTKMDLSIESLGEGASGPALRLLVKKAFTMTAKRE